VGRQAELDTLLALLEMARHGHGGLALVAGEPGVGKTRLVQEIANRAVMQRWRVIYGRATEMEGAPPYLPFVEALREYADACPIESLRAQLEQGASDVALMLPGIRQRLPEISTSAIPSGESARHILMASLREFLLAIARASDPGLLIILDDLHWADASTLLLVKDLARKVAGSHVLVIGTYRGAELDLTKTLRDLLAEASREGTGEHVALTPLSPADVSAFVANLCGRSLAPGVIDAIYSKTEGNPFFVAELVRHLVSGARDISAAATPGTDTSIPEGVRHVIRQRLSRLSRAANNLLRAGAVLGDGFEFDVLADVLGVSAEPTIDALEEAVSAEVLREDGVGYRFTHALIRETLYAGLSAPRRQRLHGAAAAAIERVHAGTIEVHLTSVAAHYRRAGSAADRATAIAYSLRAGEAATAVFAWEEAATHWDAALELMETQGTDPEVRGRHLERLAELMEILGWDSYSKQIAYLEQALELYRRVGASESMTRVNIELAGAYTMNNAGTMNVQRGISHLKAAEELLSQRPLSESLRSQLYRKLANAYVWSGRTADGLVASHRALTIDARLAPEDRWVVPHSAGWHLAADGRLAEGLALMEGAWEASRSFGQMGSFVASAYRSDWAFFLGDPLGAHDWRQRELANSRHAAARRRAILSGMATACAEAGDLAQAVRLQTEADIPGLDLLVVVFPEPLIAFRMGEWERSCALWTEALERHRRTGSRWCEADFACWLGRVYRVLGDVTAAEAALGEALAIGTDAPSQLIEMWTRPELAMICAADGRHTEARQHIVRCRAIMAAGEDWRGLAGRVALAEAVSATVLENWEIAERRFDDSLSIFQRWSLPWSEAEALG
jgi:tetratricopeptide (TPR) repeat protein